MKKVGGGSVTDSFLVTGVAFKKTFSYAGFEQQPKSFDKPSILLLNVELELKSEKVGRTDCFQVASGRGQEGCFSFRKRPLVIGKVRLRFCCRKTMNAGVVVLTIYQV